MANYRVTLDDPWQNVNIDASSSEDAESKARAQYPGRRVKRVSNEPMPPWQPGEMSAAPSGTGAKPITPAAAHKMAANSNEVGDIIRRHNGLPYFSSGNDFTTQPPGINYGCQGVFKNESDARIAEQEVRALGAEIANPVHPASSGGNWSFTAKWKQARGAMSVRALSRGALVEGRVIFARGGDVFLATAGGVRMAKRATVRMAGLGAAVHCPVCNKVVDVVPPYPGVVQPHRNDSSNDRGNCAGTGKDASGLRNLYQE